ncbi:unnamed protein product [Closterium sp. Yama58-4]|nr:unnamed protein product [Closterium sp. Yama58-4]
MRNSRASDRHLMSDAVGNIFTGCKHLVSLDLTWPDERGPHDHIPDERAPVLPPSISCEQFTFLRVKSVQFAELPTDFGSLSRLRDSRELSHDSPARRLRGTCEAEEAAAEFVEIAELPDSLGDLPNLSELSIESRSWLSALPENIHQLSNLKELRRRGLSALRALPDSLVRLPALQCLHIRECDRLTQLPPSLSMCVTLQLLTVKSCYFMELLPDAVVLKPLEGKKYKKKKKKTKAS